MPERTKEELDALTAGVKVLCATQLIVENAKEAQQKSTPPRMKVILNKLRFDCQKLSTDFWSHLDEHEEFVFQEKLRRIEQILEE